MYVDIALYSIAKTKILENTSPVAGTDGACTQPRMTSSSLRRSHIILVPKKLIIEENQQQVCPCMYQHSIHTSRSPSPSINIGGGEN